MVRRMTTGVLGLMGRNMNEVNSARREGWVRRSIGWFGVGLGWMGYRGVQLFILLVSLWTVGAIYYFPWQVPGMGGSLAVAYLVGMPWLLWRSDCPWKTVRIPLAISLAAMLAQPLLRPSNHRSWAVDQALLPRADISGHQVHIQNVRNLVYRDAENFDVHYRDRTFDLRHVDSVWFGVEEFSSFQGLAHTFLTFGFRNGDEHDYVSVSVEIRKEEGEVFSPVSAMYRQFELMYVVGEERDLLGQRAIERGDIVYLYPMRARREQIRELFLDCVWRMNQLADQPEFYHTFTSNCTNNLVYHLNRLAPGSVNPGHLGIVFPGYSDRVAFALGMIDTDRGFQETKQRYRVDQLVREISAANDFSRQLRVLLERR